MFSVIISDENKNVIHLDYEFGIKVGDRIRHDGRDILVTSIISFDVKKCRRARECAVILNNGCLCITGLMPDLFYNCVFETKFGSKLKIFGKASSSGCINAEIISKHELDEFKSGGLVFLY